MINTDPNGGEAAEPRESLAATQPYNGMIECPCTDRLDIDREKGTVNGQPMSLNCLKGSQLKEQSNASCDPRTYVGGLRCCTDGMILLDKNQVRAEWTEKQ